MFDYHTVIFSLCQSGRRCNIVIETSHDATALNPLSIFTNHHQDPITSKHRLMSKNLSEAFRILSLKISTHVKIATTVSTPEEIATRSPIIIDSSLMVMEDLN